LPIAHHFESAADPRWYNVFVPKVKKRNEIEALRDEVIKEYELERLGYPRPCGSS